ncbi:MAG: hypothetical protein J6Y01_04140, partial [Spirochaetales bacterium]|nr:hypothetical protein [Spirochaetales bacterium]
SEGLSDVSNKIYVYTGEFTFTAVDNNQWGNMNTATDVSFIIIDSAEGWTCKHGGADGALDTSIALQYQSQNNAYIRGLTDGATYNVVVTAYAGEDLEWSTSTITVEVSAQ